MTTCRQRLAAFVLATLPLACAPAPEPNPMVVIGIDGAEWTVLRALWGEGALPNLRDLAERGATTALGTDYAFSPVIWTTVATGMVPSKHGITDFVEPGPRGDRPVSSTTRRTAALWNMASAANRRVAVVGWWPTWPAESVNGVVVTERAHREGERLFSPAEFAPRFEKLAELARTTPNDFGGNDMARERDQLTATVAPALAADAHDLLMVYFRSVDVTCHWHWDEWDAAGPAAPSRVRSAYEAVDAAIGAIVAAAPANANILVISDHGFQAQPERVRIGFNLSAVLRRLGYVEWADDEIDMSRTRVYPYASPLHRAVKLVRFALAGREEGGTVKPRERAGIRRGLEADLERVTWAGGEPVFAVRDAAPPEERRGGDFVIKILPEGATETLLVDGEPWDGPVGYVRRITGGHEPDTSGILIAAGPDIDPDAPLDGIDIHDIAPTVLYGMDLPVAEDFDGEPWQTLFAERYRDDRELVTIASWGAARHEDGTAEGEDEGELVDELRALGYLD